MDKLGHVPVLRDRALDWLEPIAGARMLDATFGGGGYTRALLARGADALVAIDRDPDAVARARALAATEPRLEVVAARFGELDRHVQGPVDGVVFDLGVSSFQLDTPERGFSFRFDGPLDMRMQPEGPSAAELVNGSGEAELVELLRRYGEEPKARRIVRAIVAQRRRAPFTRTLELAEVVRRAAGGDRAGAIDAATRVFQALRIAVNDELGELERGLAAALDVLAPGGRLAVVSFHSLEDRIVKNVFRDASGAAAGVSRHQPEPAPGPPPRLEILTKRPIRPDAAETAANPRARSARLRAAKRRES